MRGHHKRSSLSVGFKHLCERKGRADVHKRSHKEERTKEKGRQINSRCKSGTLSTFSYRKMSDDQLMMMMFPGCPPRRSWSANSAPEKEEGPHRWETLECLVAGMVLLLPGCALCSVWYSGPGGGKMNAGGDWKVD